VIICVSKNQAWVNPSSSARCANFHESLAVAMPIPKSMATHSSWFEAAVNYTPLGARVEWWRIWI
jgi:hypothetical protein